MGIIYPTKTLSFDPQKASQALEEVLQIYQRHTLSVGELIAVTSNLLYSLGSSMSEFYGIKYEDKGPSIEELKKLYYSEPERIDIAFMLQGLTMSTWYESWQEQNVNKEKE